jgi:hypothetical protein
MRSCEGAVFVRQGGWRGCMLRIWYCEVIEGNIQGVSPVELVGGLLVYEEAGLR